ncbi:MAG: tetratricopeptide repeat protein, partial [Saprospiraceae bacterium]
MKLITIKILCLLFALQSYAMMPETQAILDLYQPTEKLATLKSEYDFWKKKSTAHPTQHAFKVQLANANTALFSATAELKYLKEAEYLLEAVRTAESNQKASTLRALAHNFISQHRFCEAMNLVLRAQEIGSEKRATDLMLFDLYEELGDDAAQKNTLAKLAEQQDFNYYIRLAKWQDGQGNLDQTIELMKVAEKIAETSKQTALKIWVYTNLADYYGHAGEIATSKSYYLKALALNSADWYSMKGLAWMAYANDRDPQAAIAILDKIATKSADPGISLLKAEILAYTGQTKAAHHKHNEVAKLVSQADYGNMYNSFLCEHYLQTNK